jgi:hypothetical protein
MLVIGLIIGWILGLATIIVPTMIAHYIAAIEEQKRYEKQCKNYMQMKHD